AKARGARIYAELYGYGVSCDGGHITAPDKDGVAAAYAMSQAIKDACIDPSEIGYINAHGTSTLLGDQAETTAIKSVFKEHAKSVSISSTKSQLGHLLGASGGVELIFCILALRDSLIPPTINLENPDPMCDLDYTPNQARQRQISIAMSNSFGFGGHNGSLIVGKLRND
ncbi:MAG TPA: beta-ketoacyl-[acyl-carrier-protein] synthase II, partial [Thermoguttaceae bacterium]